MLFENDAGTLYQGDVLETLGQMEDGSIQCCVTSPPYWGLRDYGVAGQLGLEETPEEYVSRMVEVFEEVRRVLRKDGTLWLNIGDSYAGGGGYAPNAPSTQTSLSGRFHGRQGAKQGQNSPGNVVGLKPKNLCLIPFRLAIALQDAGWWVRSDIAWCKKSAMPESCTDRPTSAWEHVFLLSKSQKYFYDAEAIKEPLKTELHAPGWASEVTDRNDRAPDNEANFRKWGSVSGANLRNYWLLGPEPYPEAHFATFPTEIPRRAIRAGTSQKGCCPVCAAPWERVVEPSKEYAKHLNKDWADYQKDADEGRGHSISAQRPTKRGAPSLTSSYNTTGWAPTCSCDAGEPAPCTVLDPFMGSGTTAVVAQTEGRHWIGIDISEEYCNLAIRRIQNEAAQYSMAI